MSTDFSAVLSSGSRSPALICYQAIVKGTAASMQAATMVLQKEATRSRFNSGESPLPSEHSDPHHHFGQCRELPKKPFSDQPQVVKSGQSSRNLPFLLLRYPVQVVTVSKSTFKGCCYCYMHLQGILLMQSSCPSPYRNTPHHCSPRQATPTVRLQHITIH